MSDEIKKTITIEKPKKKRPLIKVIVIFFVIVAVVLGVFFRIAFAKISVLTEAIEKFNVAAETTYKQIAMQYNEPVEKATVNGIYFDNSIFNLGFDCLENGEAVSGNCILANDDFSIVVKYPTLDRVVDSVANYDSQEELADGLVYVYEMMERNDIESHSDFKVVSFKTNLSEISFKEWISLSAEQMNDILNFAAYKQNMLNDDGIVEHTVYDANNSNFRFIIQKMKMDSGEIWYGINAYRVEDAKVTDICTEIKILLDESDMISDEQIFEFLSSLSYNPGVRTKSDLEDELRTYLPEESGHDFHLMKTVLIDDKQFLIYETWIVGNPGCYAIDLTGTEAYRCFDDLESADDWERLEKDGIE